MLNPIVPGLWLANPHKVGGGLGSKRKRRRAKLKRKRRSRRRSNIGNLTIMNPKGGSMARKRRRTRRRKSYAKKRRVYHRKKYYAKKRPHRRRRRKAYGKKRRTYRRRRKAYAKNPKRYGKRRHRRRRNPSYGSVARRSYGAARSLFSMGMAKNVVAGMAGFFGLQYIEAYIPFVPATPTGAFVKKGIAAVAAYMIAGFIPGVKQAQRRYVLYGAALNIGLDFVQALPGISESVAAATKLSGYGQGSLDMPSPTPARLTPTALIPAVLQ